MQMKTTTFLRLGGLAIILAHILSLINNVLYLLQGAQPPDMFRTLLNLLGQVPIFILGLIALYVSLARRGGGVGFIAFLLLFYSYLGDIAAWTLNLAVAQGITTQDQINQNSFNMAAQNVLSWLFWLGLVLFGYTIFRSGVYPKVAGVLLALVAPVSYLTGLLDFMTPIFILLSFGAWVWLGWLLASKGGTMMEPIGETTNALQA
jgi:hypothetical protein